MSVLTVMDDLARRGVLLLADGSSLLIDGPADCIDNELRTWLDGHRTEIIALLTAPAVVERPAAGPAPPCSPHNNPANYADAPAAGGMVRTTCKVCNRFVGYRPRPTVPRKRKASAY